jgi:hypothetical protein
LAEFARGKPGLDYDSAEDQILLYHGTNCYRRWEINRAGAIEPGRSDYSFFCTKASDAYTYARAACLRDIQPGQVNSLTSEPVVLKVVFNARTWMQVDFIQELNPGDDDRLSLSVAALGPISVASIVDIMHCTHGTRRLGAGESVRSFEDGSLIAGIHHLKDKFTERRPDAWILKKLGIFTQRVGVKMTGGEMPDLKDSDFLRKLKQTQAQA